MFLEVFFKGFLMALVVSVPLGPVGAVCIRKTMTKGFGAGVRSGIGAAAGDLIYAAIAGFGVGSLIEWMVAGQLWIQTIGASLLIFMGIRIIRSNPALNVRHNRQVKPNKWEDYLTTFGITFSNPGPLLVFVAGFAGFVVSEHTDYVSLSLAMLGVFAGGFTWWLALVSLINLFRKKIRLRHLLWVNRITGVLIFCCAAFLLYEPLCKIIELFE